MFPLTHLYFAEKIWQQVPGLPYDATLVALGSTFPDVVMAGVLEHHQTHRGVERMVDLFQQQAPELLPFALGVLTHASDPKGLDYYGDEKYHTFERGYCFEKAKPLVADVIRYCQIPSQHGLWKAHNFVEMAIELELGELYPDLQKRIFYAYQDESRINQVSGILKGYFQIPLQDVLCSINFFAKIITSEAIDTSELAAKYCVQLTNQALTIDTCGVETTISQARSLVKNDFEKFEEFVLAKMTRMLGQHL